MKQTLLLFLMACSSLAFAQVPSVPAAQDQAVPAKTLLKDGIPVPSTVQVLPQPAVRINNKNITNETVGTTRFDLQTNASVARRTLVYPDGKISVVWTTASDGPTDGYQTRGTGYNHFNGTTWGASSDSRIENNRCGWPNIVALPTDVEVTLTHEALGTGAAGGFYMSENSGIGNLDWTTAKVLDDTYNNNISNGPIWGRTVVSGDYIIMISSFTDSSQAAGRPLRVSLNGVIAPHVYSRYQISTQTWVDKNILLPDYGPDRYYNGGGDAYAIDTDGDNVAILIGGSTKDLAYWKSTDNGGTWSKTVIDSFIVGAHDGTQLFDTTDSNDGSMSILFDDEGDIHAFWGANRVLDTDSTDNNWSFFPGTNGIVHWTETRPNNFDVIGQMLDDDGSGGLNLGSNTIDADYGRYGNSTLASHPHAAIDASGNIFVIYDAPVEFNLSGDDENFRDIYIVYSTDDGATWSDPQNLTATALLEEVFANISRTVDDNLHITFMQDDDPGLYNVDDNGTVTNQPRNQNIVYMKVPVNTVLNNTVGVKEVENTLFSVAQNTPNPFTGATSIEVSVFQPTDLTLQVTNILGQTVLNQSYEKLNTGAHQLAVDANGLDAGVYFYTVQAGPYKETKRMVVR